MAERIPLNRYKRVTTSLTRETSAVYPVPPGRAGIIINALVNNNSNEDRNITVTLSRNLNDLIILNNFPLEKKDVVNIFPKKLILTDEDSLFIKTDFNNISTFEDLNAFWEFEVPVYTAQISGVVFGFSLVTQVTADWGNNTIPVTLTSFVPSNFTYDFANDTSVNITLSILEAINTP